jgi:biotin carboxylase
VPARLLHVLGGGPWQVPTVRLAKALGYRVLVTDIYADRPAYALADDHEVVDITNRAATLEVARRHRVDGILCDTTDVGVPTAAFVAQALGLPGMGYETALNFTDKSRMRDLTKGAGLAVPAYRLVADASGARTAADALGYPVVVKPVDNQSGRGVSRVADRSGVEAAYALARSFSRSGGVLVEQCAQGCEIIVDGFVVDGAARVLGIADKSPYADTPTIASRILYPGPLSPADTARIGAAAGRALAALGLKNGVFHAEFFLDGEAVTPIDVAARGGGCMIYTHVVPHVSGVDANRAMIRLAMGEAIEVAPLATPRAADIEFLRMPPGRLCEIRGAAEAAAVPGVAAVHFNVAAGDVVGPLGHKDHRPGYVVALADTAAQAVAAALQAKATIGVVMAGAAAPVAVF